jgi:hypothetical protein
MGQEKAYERIYRKLRDGSAKLQERARLRLDGLLGAARSKLEALRVAQASAGNP